VAEDFRHAAHFQQRTIGLRYVGTVPRRHRLSSQRHASLRCRLENDNCLTARANSRGLACCRHPAINFGAPVSADPP
jgi:hypothetical protein